MIEDYFSREADYNLVTLNFNNLSVMIFLAISHFSWMALSLNMNAREWVQKRRDSVRPWSEFVNFGKFKVIITCSKKYILQTYTGTCSDIKSNYMLGMVI